MALFGDVGSSTYSSSPYSTPAPFAIVKKTNLVKSSRKRGVIPTQSPATRNNNTKDCCIKTSELNFGVKLK